MLWKIHWNTKRCKSEKIPSVVDMLWTNEFYVYKTGDQGRSFANILLFKNVETNPVGLQKSNHVDPTLTVKASCTVKVILERFRF